MPTTPTTPRLMTVPEVARELRVDPATVRRWITSQRLPATRLGRDYRVSSRDLAAAMTAARTTSTALTLDVGSPQVVTR